ncbi:MAG: hypothetical protein OXI34_15895 [Chloroflexota bacterium]|nr:hypothetical protein [Chloroflexota bacterium]MDE2855450.1 hypothetical protein [Chloroflexota bacterium]MDE2947164.1 hypothetical protein [Chloroflexota bacterium]
MDEPVKNATARDSSVEPRPEEAELNPEQRALLRSLHRSFQQAARGETRDFLEFLQELRLEREAEENADNSHA